MLKYWPLRSGIDKWPSCPILPLINKIKIVCDIGWSPAISAWDCHLIHDNDIGLLSTADMKCLHWSLFCQINLSEYFRMNFPSTFCKRTSFQSAVFYSGPVFFRTSFHRTFVFTYCAVRIWRGTRRDWTDLQAPKGYPPLTAISCTLQPPIRRTFPITSAQI